MEAALSIQQLNNQKNTKIKKSIKKSGNGLFTQFSVITRFSFLQ